MHAVSTRAGGSRRINGSEARSQVMISTGEIRNNNGQIQFSLTVLETTQLRPKLKLVDANPASSFTPHRIDLSGSQMLAGCLSAFCSVGLLLWAFLHLWLFEQ
jgi:hypothetical protein